MDWWKLCLGAVGRSGWGTGRGGRGLPAARSGGTPDIRKRNGHHLPADQATPIRHARMLHTR